MLQYREAVGNGNPEMRSWHLGLFYGVCGGGERGLEGLKSRLRSASQALGASGSGPWETASHMGLTHQKFASQEREGMKNKPAG